MDAAYRVGPVGRISHEKEICILPKILSLIICGRWSRGKSTSVTVTMCVNSVQRMGSSNRWVQWVATDRGGCLPDDPVNAVQWVENGWSLIIKIIIDCKKIIMKDLGTVHNYFGLFFVFNWSSDIIEYLSINSLSHFISFIFHCYYHVEFNYFLLHF